MARVVFVLVLFVAALAYAQTDKSGTARSNMTEFEKASGLSDSEKQEKASQYTSEMKGVLTQVLALLKEAREDKDVIKVNCVNEKLTKIKGLIRIAEQADITLQEAIAKGERDAATHEFHKISISHQKVRILKTEAEQCIGELAFAVGKTSVEVEVDKETVPDDDPTDVELPDTPVFRPPAASPYE